MIYHIFSLLIIFQVKHFLADYPLQNEYMLGKIKAKEWFFPLLAHTSVHAIMTFCITVWFGIGQAIVLSLFDMFIHSVMDYVKANKKLLGRFNPTQKAFWSVLGFDQAVHHLTGLAIIYWLFRNK